MQPMPLVQILVVKATLQASKLIAQALRPFLVFAG